MPSFCIRRQTTLASLFHNKCLKLEGFKKYNATWNKPNENGFVYVVNFQNRFGNLGDDCKMTVNLGVFLPILQADWAKEKQGKYIKEENCTFPFRERLGSLALGKDTWWAMSDEPDELGLMLKDLYEAYAVDWFKTYSNYDSIVAWWKALDEERQTVMGIGSPMARLFGKLGYLVEAKYLFEAIFQRYRYERPHGMPSLIREAQEYGITLELDNQ